MVSAERDGEQVAVLAPSRNYYSSVTSDGSVRGFFEGEATSEVGRRTRAGGDLWTAMRPDLARYDSFIEGADRRITQATRRRGRRRRALPGAAARRPPGARGQQPRRALHRGRAPVDFRVNVNPFVIWIWIGGAIAVGGA